MANHLCSTIARNEDLVYLLKEALRHSARYAEPLSLLRIQMQTASKEFAERLLASALRATDILIQLPSDELAVLLPTTDFLGATVVAEQLLLLLPMSIGVASTDMSPLTLQQNSEAALQKAIERGGNRVCF